MHSVITNIKVKRTEGCSKTDESSSPRGQVSLSPLILNSFDSCLTREVVWREMSGPQILEDAHQEAETRPSLKFSQALYPRSTASRITATTADTSLSPFRFVSNILNNNNNMARKMNAKRTDATATAADREAE